MHMRVSALLLLTFSIAIAQQAAPPAFEVASLKAAGSAEQVTMTPNGGRAVRISRGCRKPNPGSVNCTNATLKMLLVQAYEVKNYQVEGPAWIDSDGFDLLAKIPSGVPVAQVPAMLQALLAERLNVKLHKEARSLPAYDMTVAKGGLKLKEVDPAELEAAKAAAADGPPTLPAPGGRGTPPPGAIMIGISSDGARTFRGRMTMEQLASYLTNNLSRPVFDQTGLKGTYDIELTYLADDSDPLSSQMRAALGPDAHSDKQDANTPIATLMQAVQQTLGLKLDAKKAPVDVYIVDSANKVPTEN